MDEVRADLTQRLESLRKTSANLRGEVAESLGGAGDATGQWSELSNRQAEEEAALKVLGVESELQQELLDTIARIDQAQYGVCESCGKKIAKDRLRAVPHARHCIHCAG